jgi:hypothetical protein
MNDWDTLRKMDLPEVDDIESVDYEARPPKCCVCGEAGHVDEYWLVMKLGFAHERCIQ